MHLDEKTSDITREPPSFSNSVINTGNNSPKTKDILKTSVFAVLSPENQEDTLNKIAN